MSAAPFARRVLLAAALLAPCLAARADAAPPARDPLVPDSAPAAETRVALEVVERNNMPLVKARVDGAECVLLLDTGATHTTFDVSFVRRALPDAKLVPVLMAADTNVEKNPECFRVSSLSVGAARFGGFVAMALDLGHLRRSVSPSVDGVLGMNVIGRARALLSLSSRSIVFNPQSADGFGPPLLSLDPADGFHVAAKSGGASLEFLVDSGSSLTTVKRGSWPVAAKGCDGADRAKFAISDINGISAAKAAPGVPGAVYLGIPVEIAPVVCDEDQNLLGADTLLKYDALMALPSIRFRKASVPAER